MTLVSPRADPEQDVQDQIGHGEDRVGHDEHQADGTDGRPSFYVVVLSGFTILAMVIVCVERTYNV